MKFEISGIDFQDMKEFMDDLVMGHDLRTYRLKETAYKTKGVLTPERIERWLVLTVNKRYWIKTWKDVGFDPEDTKQWLEESFKEDLEGQGYKVKVRLIE